MPDLSFGQLAGASAIGAGISSIGGLLSGLFSHGSQSALMGRQFEFNKNLMALGQNFNLQTMRQEDKYQRGLLQDSAMLAKQGLINAGLNVGAMSDSFSPAQSMASGSAPSGSVGLGSGARFELGLLDGMRAISEIKNIESQTAKNNEEVGKIGAETEVAEKQALLLDSLKNKEDELAKNVHQDTENKIEVYKNLQADTRLKSAQAYNQYSQADIAYEQLDLNTKATLANVALMEEQGKLAKSQAAAAYKSICVMNATIDEIATRCDVNRENVEVLKAQAYSIHEEGDLKNFENQFKRYVGYEKMGEFERKMMDRKLDLIQTEVWQNRANTIKIGTETADIVANRVQSIVRQSVTGGLFM